MFPRTVTLAVVAFWLAMMGLLFWHDLWPALAPGQPPAFVLELTQETEGIASQQWVVTRRDPEVLDKERGAPRRGWSLARKDREVYQLRIWTEYDKLDDTFRL